MTGVFVPIAESYHATHGRGLGGETPKGDLKGKTCDHGKLVCRSGNGAAFFKSHSLGLGVYFILQPLEGQYIKVIKFGGFLLREEILQACVFRLV